MKHFQVPASAAELVPPKAVLEKDPAAKVATFSFREFSTFIWLEDPRAYTSEHDGKQSVVKLRRWQKVIDAFEAAEPGDWISLEDEDYATLKTIVEAPQRQFQVGHTRIALACMPFVDAVLGAKNEKPAVVAEKAIEAVS